MNEPRDLSTRAISLARMIDRLSPGEFTIRLKKAGRQRAWQVQIDNETSRETIENRELGGTDGAFE